LTSSNHATVLIVDDEPLTCQLISKVINQETYFDVVGIAHEGQDAVALVDELQPDIVLLDLTMPGETDGLSALVMIKEQNPKTRVLVLTGHKDPKLVREALFRGASGYINKTDIFRNLPGTMQNLLRGDIAIVEPDLMRQAVKSTYSRKEELSEKEQLISNLTQRERTVLELIAQGYDNQKIANKLYISYNTVKSHTSNIFDKLSVPDRTQAALIALQAGLGIGNSTSG